MSPVKQRRWRSQARTLDDDALVQRMSENAYRAMRDGPQRVEAHAQGLLAIYQSLLAEHKAHAA